MNITVSSKEMEKVSLIKTDKPNLIIRRNGKSSIIISNEISAELFMQAALNDVSIDSKEDFSFAINSMLFTNAIRNLNTCELIIFSYDDNDSRFVISGVGTKLKYKIPIALYEHEIPNKWESDIILKTKADSFFQAMKQVEFACVDRQDVRRHLQGVNMLLKDESTIELCATDARQLAISTIPNLSSVDHVGKAVILSPEFVDSCNKAWLLEASPEIELGIKQGTMIFSTASYTFVTRLIDGEFPDYKQIVDNLGEAKMSFKFNLVEMEKTISSTNINPANNRNLFMIMKDEIKVHVLDQSDSENYMAPIETSNIPDDGIEFAVNPKFLPNFIKANKAFFNDVTVKIVSAVKPFVAEQESVKYIMVPLK